MRRIIVSAVNFIEGGALTVLRQCVDAAHTLPAGWRMTVLVNDSALVDTTQVDAIAFPKPKQSWLNRLKFEYWDLHRISKGMGADIWLSLHDMTPRVRAGQQYVYCHNPSPFHKLTMRDIWIDPKFALFAIAYGLIYQFRIRENDAVIVQQQWLRSAFVRRYAAQDTIVAHPVAMKSSFKREARPSAISHFCYPTLPRVFKNIELIGEALKLLEADSRWHGRVRVTISGSENRYARWIEHRYGALNSLELIGRQDRDGMAALYAWSECLLFPSRLETWGLPISEAKGRGLPIIAADLPYARETVGCYDVASFVNPVSPEDLAAKLLSAHLGEWAAEAQVGPPPEEPYAADWPALLEIMIRRLQGSQSHADEGR